MCFADIGEREEALKYGKVYDIHGLPPYLDVPSSWPDPGWGYRNGLPEPKMQSFFKRLFGG